MADDRNSGHWNSGNRNSGNWNSGNWNSGHRNSGHWNSGHRNSGFFCTDMAPVRIFNKETDTPLSEINFPDLLYFNLTEWVDSSEMSDAEKTDHPLHETIGGYLKTYSYKEAFKKSWDKATAEDREKLFKLPNFDAEIFKEISGIDVKESSIISIGGKKYRTRDIEIALSKLESVE